MVFIALTLQKLKKNHLQILQIKNDFDVSSFPKILLTVGSFCFNPTWKPCFRLVFNLTLHPIQPRKWNVFKKKSKISVLRTLYITDLRYTYLD